jgi:23S rRNA pseudouridine1911/1915/1917 synthase
MADQALVLEKKQWTVATDRDGVRLDFFVRRCLPGLSSRALDAAIAAGVFRINGRRARKGDRVAVGNRVSFEGPAHWLADAPLPGSGLRAPILYEDSHLLVVDKPAGMDSHGFSGRHLNTLANFLVARRPETLGVGKSKWEPGLVHRLDRETSGLVMAAKTQTAFAHTRLQFRQRRIKKYYWALVFGMTPFEGSMDYPIARDTRDKRRMRSLTPSSKVKRGQKIWPALTRYRRLATCRRFSLLEVEIATGVTHQIRVHLAAIGHPVVGDAIYGAAEADNLGLKRHFLHACRIEFYHPANERKVRVASRLPAELRKILDDLGMKI